MSEIRCACALLVTPYRMRFVRMVIGETTGVLPLCVLVSTCCCSDGALHYESSLSRMRVDGATSPT